MGFSGFFLFGGVGTAWRLGKVYQVSHRFGFDSIRSDKERRCETG